VYYRGVWYDGVTTTAQGTAVLIDYKDGYDGFLNADGTGLADWVARNPNIKFEDGLVNQAERQVNAANGASVEWRCSSERFTNYLNSLFTRSGIRNIEAVYTPRK
jgi:hypothetical protein